MSDDLPSERRSARQGRPAEAAERRGVGPPALDEVFLDDEEVEPGEEDTKTVAALDALGSPAAPPEESSPARSAPSGARLSAPPGAINLRPRVSAPPMAVPQIRAPVSTPPPYLGRVSAVDLSDDVSLEPEVGAWTEFAERPGPDDGGPESEPIAFRESHAPASAPFADVESDPYPAELADAAPAPDDEELADADLYSVPEQDRRPAADPARALRASAAPRQRPAAGPDASLRALFAASQSRPQSLPPPPPAGAPRPSTPAPAVARPAFPSPAPVARVDRHQAPKTLVSGPPDAAPLPLPETPPELLRARSRRPGWVVLLTLLLLGGVALGFRYLESTQPGSLLLSVAAKRGVQVSGVRLYLDGQLVCRATPCEVSQLEAGTHFVRAEADDFPPTADQAVVVQPREQTIHEIVLERPPGDARVSIVTPVPGFSVTLDGSERGVTPIDLTGLEPGEHTLVLERDGFQRHNEVVTLEQGKTAEVRPRPLLLQGTLRVRALRGSENAEVRLDGKLVALPLERKLPASSPHVLEARKPRGVAFVRKLEFTPESPVVEIELNLASPSQALEQEEKPPRGDLAKGASGSGRSTLNFNSIPSSSVVLDGKPLGQTPLMGVGVSPGPHNVVFIHPELGRKPVQVDVDEGAKRTVSVRF